MAKQLFIGMVFLIAFLLAPNLVAENFKAIRTSPFKWWYVVISVGIIGTIFQFLGIRVDYLIYFISILTISGTFRFRKHIDCHFFLQKMRESFLFWLLLAPILIYGVSETIYNPVFEWDAAAIWFNKTKGFLNHLKTNELPNAFYPNLGPALWSIALKVLGIGQEPIGRLIFFGFFISWIGTLRCFLNQSNKAIIPLLIGYAAFDTMHFTSGYQDGLIFICLNLAVLSFVQSFKTGNKQFSNFSYALCGALASIKNEGAIIGLILTGLATTYQFLIIKKSYKSLLIELLNYACVLAIPLLIKLLSNINILNFGSDSFNVTNVAEFLNRIDRIPHIANYLLAFIAKEKLLFVTLLAFTFLKFKSYEHIFFVHSFLILHFALIFLIFILTNSNLEWHLATAFDRIDAGPIFGGLGSSQL